MDEPDKTAATRQQIKEMRKIPPLHLALMLVLAATAGGFLYTLKHGAKQEHAVTAEDAALLASIRDNSNGEIVRAAEGRFGGESKNVEQRALVARVGHLIATKTDAKLSPVKLHFYLLAEPNSIAAYGLSTGDIFITTAMLNRLQTEGELAAVLAHVTAHALAGDALTPLTGTMLPVWRHSEAQENAADILTVKLMAQAGYDPNAFVNMLLVLVKAYEAKADVGFFVAHPNADGRLEAITANIRALYPNGVPREFSK